MIYMPINNADDSYPIVSGPPLGHFPTNHSEAVFYWSDKSQLGCSQTVTVDGRETVISTDYLVGPITAELHDAVPPHPPGTHIITVGVFLTPLNKGSHTVSFTIKEEEDLILEMTGGVPFEVTFTYTVEVD
jgi:hypothetical protein